ncbi:hypothetical protein BJ508DRAFT_324001 [Ascobolus immersus RN42]|uniref:Uncharacterized protein n=1 Tax=Ascobolus immersus RN42 TaxID=1160509 RepID=A0A3N4IIL0_ASCIM|nr:hypothetical protein BJ508DRAFT_324001 [Ascobolus immersus RN42]
MTSYANLPNELRLEIALYSSDWGTYTALRLLNRSTYSLLSAEYSVRKWAKLNCADGMHIRLPPNRLLAAIFEQHKTQRASRFLEEIGEQLELLQASSGAGIPPAIEASLVVGSPDYLRLLKASNWEVWRHALSASTAVPPCNDPSYVKSLLDYRRNSRTRIPDLCSANVGENPHGYSLYSEIYRMGAIEYEIWEPLDSIHQFIKHARTGEKHHHGPACPLVLPGNAFRKSYIWARSRLLFARWIETLFGEIPKKWENFRQLREFLEVAKDELQEVLWWMALLRDLYEYVNCRCMFGRKRWTLGRRHVVSLPDVFLLCLENLQL